MSPIVGRTLVFVMGVPRSGTTWIEELIAQDPRTVSAHESHLFDEYLTSAATAWWRRPKRRDGLPQFMGLEDYLAACRALTDRVFAHVAAKRPEAKVILEKTPNHLQHWRFISMLYPDAWFVITVRDPRGVAASYRAARTWAQRWANLGVVAVARTWVQGMRAAREACEVHGRVVLVGYEKALSDPVTTVRNLFQALGLPVDDDAAQAYVRACQPEAMRQRHVAAGTNAGFVRTASAQGWRTELSRRRIKTIEAIAADEMRVFGYERVTTGRARLTRMADRAIQAFGRRAAGLVAWARGRL